MKHSWNGQIYKDIYLQGLFIEPGKCSKLIQGVIRLIERGDPSQVMDTDIISELNSGRIKLDGMMLLNMNPCVTQ